LDEIQSKSKNELRGMINANSIAASTTMNVGDQAAFIAQAEFLMRELDRRSDSWVSLRDLILEIVVIALIGWEIHMSYRAERLPGACNGRLRRCARGSANPSASGRHVP
jgi:hypothetical protein